MVYRYLYEAMNSRESFLAIVLVLVSCGNLVAQTKSPEDGAKQKAAVEAKNKEIRKENAAMAAALKAGNDAYLAKRYDEAIDRFSSAANGYPTHPGVPTLLHNMALTYLARGTESYNSAIKTTDKNAKEALMFSSLADFLKARQIAEGAALAFREQIGKSDDNGFAAANLIKVRSTQANALRLAVKMDISRLKTAIDAYNQYIAVESDRTLKIKARLELSQMLLDSGDSIQAAGEATKVLSLEFDPNNTEALFIAGVGLAFGGTGNESTQHGATYLKRFLSIAAANDPKRKDAQDTLDFLKTEGIEPK